MNPMVDGWRGDDWFHNGAFREQNMPYIYEQTATRANEEKWLTSNFDDYDTYMRAGSAGELGKERGMDQIGFWQQGDRRIRRMTAGGASRRWIRCSPRSR